MTDKSSPSSPVEIDISIVETWPWKNRIRYWGQTRNLYNDATPLTQLTKLNEEYDELEMGIEANDKDEVKDAIGDMCVVLCHIAHMYDLDFEQCLNHAWDEIKHRKGYMENGVFIKEENNQFPFEKK